MYTKNTRLTVGFTFFFFFVSVYSAVAEKPLVYQNRGNRYEGIKWKPVSGYDIELISAYVDHISEINYLPKQLKVKFYLKQPSEVHLTVRELDYKYYYWMDKIQPSAPWRLGFDNVFTWSTQDVIQQLGELRMHELGVVARLGKPEPGKVERVAPVLFFHDQPPVTIKGYLFTFKTNGDARLTCSFYKEGEAEPVFTQLFRRQRSGRPFTVRWNSTQATAGSYKLVVRGYDLQTNDPIDQTVHFYHRPDVK